MARQLGAARQSKTLHPSTAAAGRLVLSSAAAVVSVVTTPTLRQVGAAATGLVSGQGADVGQVVMAALAVVKTLGFRCRPRCCVL
ncbi:hypothetical protein OOZ63_24170 [Paucibacter sp. PLA-PC-4]|uniref:hypothetical protein n=1 Tax=Paucibacter sp. PLA-PC-4 TaxID=2993655 RepID=UPI00224AF51C|nr:hypothetical protein [Paucibacter sp. PLA-PC-4]MCX2864932.1 hypothetical protein [Paucibacter sp. PLA-PC-4]